MRYQPTVRLGVNCTPAAPSARAGIFVCALDSTQRNDGGDHEQCELSLGDDVLAQVVGFGSFDDGIRGAKFRLKALQQFEISRNVDTTPTASTTIVIVRRVLRKFVSAVGSRKPASLDAAEPTGKLLDDASIVHVSPRDALRQSAPRRSRAANLLILRN
jgi:hypothetical protein